MRDALDRRPRALKAAAALGAALALALSVSALAMRGSAAAWSGRADAAARSERADADAAAKRNAAAIRALTQPFTIAALPDTQFYSADHSPYFRRQVHWVLTHAASRHIAFVTQLGDVVDDSFISSQWATAQQALGPLLRRDTLPFSIVRGNHDYATLFLQNFPVWRMREKRWFVGSSPSGLAQAQTFLVQKARFLHIGFEYAPSAEELAWANALLRRPALKGMPVVVSTHDYMVYGARDSTGESIWNGFVKKNRMVFMVLCGHVHLESAIVSRDAAGQPVYQMLSDYQSRPNGGDGLMRLIRIDPARGRIQVRTFSPYYDGAPANHYETDRDSQFAYTLNVRARLTWKP